MEQVIIGLVGLNLMIAVYQEHARRADKAALRKEIAALRDGFMGELGAVRGEMAALRDGLNGEMAALRGEFKGEIAALRDETQKGLARVNRRVDDLVAIMADLAEKVGEVRGRSKVLTPVE